MHAPATSPTTAEFKGSYRLSGRLRPNRPAWPGFPLTAGLLFQGFCPNKSLPTGFVDCNGNVVQENCGDDDPHDFQQAECAAIKQTGERQLRRHSKYKNRAKNGRRGPCDGTPVWPHLEACEQSEQYNDWQRGNQSGEPPVAKRIVHLRPSLHPSSQGSELAILPAQIRGIANARRLLNSASLAQPKPFCRASITFLANESQERSRGRGGDDDLECDSSGVDDSASSVPTEKEDGEG